MRTRKFARLLYFVLVIPSLTLGGSALEYLAIARQRSHCPQIPHWNRFEAALAINGVLVSPQGPLRTHGRSAINDKMNRESLPVYGALPGACVFVRHIAGARHTTAESASIISSTTYA
jgi:hypothetical protein